MNRPRLTLGALALACTLAAPAADAQAQRERREPAERLDRRVEALDRALDLSDAQEREVRGILGAAQAEQLALRQSRTAERTARREALREARARGERPQRNAAADGRREAARREAAERRARTDARLLGVLDARQAGLYRELQARRAERMEDRMEQRRERRTERRDARRQGRQ